jgi:hypothetical protein
VNRADRRAAFAIRPETAREELLHDALWYLNQELARVARLAATARGRLEQGDRDGALLELELASLSQGGQSEHHAPGATATA